MLSSIAAGAVITCDLERSGRIFRIFFLVTRRQDDSE
jgi:hypothetical protein